MTVLDDIEQARLAPGRIVMFTYCNYSAPIATALGGNIVKAGDIEPAVIVKVNDRKTGSCNLKVFRDGPVDFWATSRELTASGQSVEGFFHFSVNEAVRT